MVHDSGDVDLTDLDTFADGFPHDIFRLHRDQAPVWRHGPTTRPSGCSAPATYSSETGGDRPDGAR